MVKVRIQDNTLKWRPFYDVSCPATECKHCLFRYKCYTQREAIITTAEIDDLSLSFVSDSVVARLHADGNTGYSFYTKLFNKMVERC